MLEHYSHIRLAAKRQALDALDERCEQERKAARAARPIADEPPAGVHLDEQRLREARIMYPDLRVLPWPPADGHMLH